MDYGPYMHRKGGSSKQPALKTFFPTDAELMEAAIVEEDGPSSPIPGSEWNATRQPDIYFDATRLAATLNEAAHDLGLQAWKLTSALRNVRQAETQSQRSGAILELVKLYEEFNRNSSVDTKVRMLVDQLANTIESDREKPVPETIPGMSGSIYPSMDRYYTLRPVWEFIVAIRKAFKRSDG